jgi:HSP20 family protein
VSGAHRPSAALSANEKRRNVMLTLWNQFDDLFSDELFKGRRQLQRSFWPAVDIEEVQDGYMLTADVPGMNPEEIDITVEDGVLSLKGERKSENKDEHDGYKRIERTFGSFQRTFVLPKGVSADAVEAKVENGQLVVRIPKPVAALPRKVTVSGNLPEMSAKKTG